MRTELMREGKTAKNAAGKLGVALPTDDKADVTVNEEFNHRYVTFSIRVIKTSIDGSWKN